MLRIFLDFSKSISRSRKGITTSTSILIKEAETRLLRCPRMEAEEAMITSRLASIGIKTDVLMKQRTPEENAAICKDPTIAIKEMVRDNPRLEKYKLTTFEHVQTLAKRRAESIFNNFLRLRAILGKHESLLQKRWCKKSPEQRRKILLSAWPDMASNHRPDLRALWQETSPNNQNTSRPRDAFMFPYISIEDLAKSKPLLLLLGSRSRHIPATFVNSDWNTTELGQRCEVVYPTVLLGWIMLLQPNAYGSLHPHTKESWHTLKTGQSFPPGIGLLILEIQQRLMAFLVTCAELILHGLDLEAVDLESSTSLSPSPTSSVPTAPGSVDLRPSLDTVVQEAPYRVPDQFDFARLYSFVYAKRDEAEDHVRSLREDPSYFVKVIKELSVAKEEALRTIDGVPSSWSVAKTSSFYEKIIRCVVNVAYIEATRWDDTWQQLKKIMALRKQYGKRISPTETPPKDYECAVGLLSVQLEELLIGVSVNLRKEMITSPELRRYFVPRPRHPRNRSLTTHVDKVSIPRNDYFLWVISQLIDDKPPLEHFSGLLHELDRMMRSDEKQRRRISPWGAGAISTLAIVYELKRQTALSQPEIKIESLVPDHILKADSKRRNELVDRFEAILMQARDDSAFATLGIPLSKFNHPSDKRQTAATNEAMRSAEKYLDEFWAGVDQYFVRKTGSTLNDLAKEKITIRELYRTPAWTEPTNSAAPKRKEGEDMSVSLLAATLEERTERTIMKANNPLPRAKQKTRGVAADAAVSSGVSPSTNAVEKDSSAISSPDPVFSLDKRAYKVFSSLFRLSTKDGVPGELPWNDFLYAMVAIGFSVQSLDGSASIFSRTDGRLDRSIIFHEPHPESKMPYLIVKRVGRRLNRIFGWTAGNFVKA